jgi:hypothetical protein
MLGLGFRFVLCVYFKRWAEEEKTVLVKKLWILIHGHLASVKCNTYLSQFEKFTLRFYHLLKRNIKFTEYSQTHNDAKEHKKLGLASAIYTVR